MTDLQLEIKELTPYKAGTPIQQEIGFDLAASTDRIMNLRRRLKENLVEIGIELIRAKSNLDHGDWEDWVRNDLGWNPSTAWRFMNAARECNGNLALAHDIDLEQFWGHKPRIPYPHSPEGEPRSIQDIERALTIAAQQLKRHFDNVERVWQDIIFYAEKLDWCIDYYASLNMREMDPLFGVTILKRIEEMVIDLQRKMEAIKMPDEIHIYHSGDLERESTIEFGELIMGGTE
jgi:hypothetical protein